MVRLSIGGSLVLRQLLFMALLVVLGIVAYFAVLDLRAMAHSVAMSDPTLAIQRAAALEVAAGTLANNLLFGIGVGCLLILGVSIPVIHRTIAQPIAMLTRQMAALAAGNTDIEIDNAQTIRKD